MPIETFLPRRYDKLINELPENYNDRSIDRDEFRFAAGTVLMSPHQRSGVIFGNRPEFYNEFPRAFVGGRRYFTEKIGDVLEDFTTASSYTDRLRLVRSSVTFVDIKNFRAIDEADEKAADQLTVEIGDMLKKACLDDSNVDTEYYVAQIFGDEFAIIAISRKLQELDNIKSSLDNLLNTFRSSFQKKQVPYKFNSKIEHGPIECRMSGTFLSEAMKNTETTTFASLIEGVIGNFIDEDDTQDGVPQGKTDKINIYKEKSNNLVSDSERTAIENIQQPTELLTRPQLIDATQKRYATDLIAEGIYPEWLLNMLSLVGYDQNLHSLAHPLLRMLISDALIDDISEPQDDIHILTHEALFAKLKYETGKLSPDEDIGLICVDLGLLKECNDILGHGTTQRLLVNIKRRLARIKGPQFEYSYIGAKEGGKFFFAVKGKKGDIKSTCENLEEEINNLIEQEKIPLKGEKGLLEDFKDGIPAKIKHNLPESTHFFGGTSLVFLRENGFDPQNVSQSVGQLFDRTRIAAEDNKIARYVDRLFESVKYPEIFVLLSKKNSRTKSRIKKIIDYMSRYNIATENLPGYVRTLLIPITTI